MGLSNTATPRYYGEFREKVRRGEIPVCEEVEMEMNRIDERIANRRIYYDDEAIEGFIRFCENECTLTDGSDLYLLDTFKLWAESLLSWYYFEERQIYEPPTPFQHSRWVRKYVQIRLIQKQYLIVARGAAKSMYASLLQNYFLNVDRDTTEGITTAPTMKQAEEVMSPIKTAITRHRGPVFKFLTQGSLQNTTGSKANRVKLASTKIGIVNYMTNSTLEIRPMSIDKLQGSRAKYWTVDEWLSGDVRENIIEAAEQSAEKNGEDYVILAVSSEGTVRNGVGDTIKMGLKKILKNEEHKDPHVSIWHYKLDDVKEVANPAMWLKAQPNLDKTVSYEKYHQAVARMERSPDQRNDILAKRFGIPMAGFTYYFSYEDTIPHRKQKFWQMTCTMGADLSLGDDFCAFTFLFPMSYGRFGVVTRSYITKLTFDKLPDALRAKYEEFLREGSLIVLEGNLLDMMEVYDDLDRFIRINEFYVRGVGYDPYNSEKFINRWIAENGAFGVAPVQQGAKTESVPLGELKILAEERLLIFYQDLMQFTMGYAVVEVDSNGNRKLVKLRTEQKIDNVSALMDAYVAFKLNQEQF